MAIPDALLVEVVRSLRMAPANLWAYEDMPNPDRPTAKALPVDLAAKLAALFAK